MSSNKPFSDDEVASEMKKMVAFIKQEAMEKAREIKVKADEEFAIEKGKIVRQETSQIDAQYERKRKQVEVQKKIEASNQNNKSRLRLLQAREEKLEELFEEARKRLTSLDEDKGKYESVLKGLILQGLYQLMEKDVKVQVRDQDVELVKKSVDSAASEFKENVGQEVKIEVGGELSKDVAGGVVVSGYNNKIHVNNTLDERLRILEEKELPIIRVDLFGPNENRKHFT